MLQRTFGAWAALAFRRWPWVLVLTLVVTAAAGVYTSRHLGFHTDTAELLSPELPFRQTVERFQAAFPQLDDSLLLVLEAPTPEQAEQAAASLASRLAGMPGTARDVFHAEGLEFFRRQGLLFQDPDELSRLAERLVDAQPLLARLLDDTTLSGFLDLLAEAAEREDLGSEALAPVYRGLTRTLESDGRSPLSWRELMAGTSAQGSYRSLVVVQPQLDYGRVDAGAEAIAGVRSAARDLQLQARYQARLGITGKAALAHDELQTVVLGAKIAGLAALAAVLVVLYLGLRSLRLVAAAVAALAVGLALTAGFATLAVGHLNLISVAFAVLYVGLGVDYAIHFLLRQRELAALGAALPEAVAGTGRDLGTSLALCTVTTAIGFSAFVPTDFLGVSELGIIAAGAMVISLVVTFSLLPALLALLRPVPRGVAPGAGGRALGRLLALPRGRPRTVRAAALALGLAALSALPLARFDYNPLNLRDPAAESVATMNALLGEAAGPWSAVALADGPDQARDHAQRLRALAPVDKVVTVFSFVPEDQDAKLAILADLPLLLGPDLLFGAPALGSSAAKQVRSAAGRLESALAAATVPGAEGLAAALAALRQRLEPLPPPARQQAVSALEQAALGTFPPAISRLQEALTAQPVTLEALPESLRSRWVSPAGLHHLQISAREDLRSPQPLEAFVEAVRSVAPAATGAPVLHLESARAVTGAFQQALVLALAGISAVLLLVLRSLRLTAVVLTPLLLGGLLTIAAMVALGIPFNFANVIALPLLLGVSVDNGVHMVHRDRLQGGGDLLRTSTARGVLFSTLTTLCGFGNLSLSPHPGTASLGLVLTLGLGVALACTLLLLPALLARRGDRAVPA